MTFLKQPLIHGGDILITKERMLFEFPSKRLGISTSPFSGGIQEYKSIFNQKLLHQVQNEKDLPGGGSQEAYLAQFAHSLNLTDCTALLTSARMDCYGHAIIKSSNTSDTIEVFATAGVDKNAARAGELPLYWESDYSSYQMIDGTINLFIFLSSSLSSGALTRSLITATEAKSALLAEIGIPSVATGYTATGTSTDGIILISDQKGPQRTDIGTYSELGYLLATAVKKAVREALEKESGWPKAPAYSLLRQLRCRPHPMKDYKQMVHRVHLMTSKENKELELALSLWLPLREAYHYKQILPEIYQKEKERLLQIYPILSSWLDWFVL